MGYKSIKRKPMLTSKHKDARIQFALKYKGLDWKRVCFSDSKRFVYEYTSGTRLKFKWCMYDEKPQVYKAKQE